MSIPPPGDSGRAPGSAEFADGADTSVEGLIAVTGQVDEVSDVDIAVAVAVPEMTGQQMAELLELEAADAAAEPAKAARLLHEAGHVREFELGLLREAAKTYAQSLTADPTLQANGWALRRIFAARGRWDNVRRLIDAEIRFAPLPTASDTADRWIESGRILEDRLGRMDEARASYQSALEADPTHAGAHLAILLFGLRRAAPADVETGLAGLISVIAEPDLRARLAVELTRASLRSQPGGESAEGVLRAADGLMQALAGGGAPGPMLAELDRVSLLADQPDLRLRVLDAFDSQLSRSPGAVSPAFAVALYREKARIFLGRGAKDAALAILDRALALAPSHPLVVLDFLDVAQETGRVGAMASLLAQGGQSLDRALRDELLLWRADVAARAGAWGEAILALDDIDAAGSSAPLAHLSRLRVLTLSGDAEQLAHAMVDEANRILTRSTGSPASPLALARAADVATRAAGLRDRVLADPVGAEALYHRALEAIPNFAPAVDGLSGLLATAARWDDLKAFLAEQAAATDDPSRRLDICRALVILHRDLAKDPAGALHWQLELGRVSTDPSGGIAVVDLALAAKQGGAAAIAVAADALVGLIDGTREPAVAAALRILRARLQPESTDYIPSLLDAHRDDPSSWASARLEEAYANADQNKVEVLRAELDAVPGPALAARAVALRFRLALLFEENGRTEEALEVLAPLRDASHSMAVAYSFDIARRSGNFVRASALLPDPAAAPETDHPLAIGTLIENALARGELLSRAGQPEAAADVFRLAATSPEAREEASAALDAALSWHQAAAGKNDGNGVLAAIRRMSELVPDALTKAQLGRESALLALCHAEATTFRSAADTAEDVDVVGRWLFAVRGGDRARAFDALAAIATEIRGAAGQRLGLMVVAGQRWNSGASGSLGEVESADGALDAELAPFAEVVFSDLPASRQSTERTARLRRSRALRLAAGRTAGSTLAEALWIEDGDGALAAGKPRAALEAFQHVLALRPDSLEATLGLRRVFRSARLRALEAAVLARLGSLLASSDRAIAYDSEAGRLFEEDGQVAVAAALYRKVLRRRPDDELAFRRLLEIYQRDADSSALENLLSFKLARDAQTAGKVDLWVQRARLRATMPDKRFLAVEDWKRVLAVVPDHPEAFRSLARAAADEGRPKLARRFYEEAIAGEPEAATRAVLALEIFPLCEQLADPDRAQFHLEAAVAAMPGDPAPREALVAFALRQGKFDLALRELARLHQEAGAGPAAAAIHVRMGRVHTTQRGDDRVATEIFVAALREDPLGDAAAELVRLVPARQALTGAEALTVDEIIAALCRSLVEDDPLDIARLERLRDLATVCSRSELADVAASALAALGVGSRRGRSREFSAPLLPATLARMGDEGATAGSRLASDLWIWIGPAVAKAEKLAPAALGATRQTRVATGADPRLSWVEAAASALGIAGLTMYVGGTDELGVAAIDAPDPILILGRGVVGGDPGSRFAVGRTLCLMRQRAGRLQRLPLAELEFSFLAAAATADVTLMPVGAPAPDPSVLRTAVKALDKHLGRKEARAIEALAPRLRAEPLDVATWRSGMLRMANRVGLLVSGDLLASLRVVTGQSSPSREALRGEEALALIRFALGEGFAAWQRAVGLDAQAGAER